jgi:phosphomannomutase
MSTLNSNEVLASCSVAFGTSGARGLVVDFTPEVCAAFTHAFMCVMADQFCFKQVALAIDNRPSSYAMAMACAKALQQLDIEPIYYGVVPTPALAYTAMLDNIPCIMVTGSHIPFDRNGLKFYRPDGEISKADEQAILAADAPFEAFDERPTLVADGRAATNYVERYASLFKGPWLTGKKIGIYEHSSAGRDLYAGLFTQLGAEVVSLERSDQFVPIDTEAVSPEDQAKALAWSDKYGFDAIFSTDGDGDRPLVSDEQGVWLRGDILGLLCSKALGIEALAVPVSCNTVIASCGEFKHVELTKIGSPYVIAEFGELSQRYARVAGFEANGGYLLGSDIQLDERPLKALPTRDALLPALMLLAAAREGGISQLVQSLPQRFTHSDRIKGFATEKSKAVLASGIAQPQALLNRLGFEAQTIAQVSTTDGLRLTLDNGDVIHLRPSGNAPELRCYAESSSAKVAKYLVEQSLKAVQTLT